MQNKAQSFNVSAQLKLLQSQAQLSNAVSCQALKDATKTWHKYQAQYDYERDDSDLIAIKRNINLIVVQVTNRVCRINPVMWTELLKLNSVITIALLNNINLEPRPVPIVAANADDNIGEVSHG